LIHHVFHVSQLEKRVGLSTEILATLPLVNPGGQLRIEPRGILGRRLVNRKGKSATELLVQWSNMTDDDVTWEDYITLKK
jgi:hypothetical protein